MSIHKLTAGSGYDYLTRQVAAMDSTDKGHTGLASYYSEKGEAPGVWVGSGMAGIDGLSAGDIVTAEQMQALFGSGHHPLAHQRRDNLQGPGLTDKDYRAATRLGVPFKVYGNDVSPYRIEVAKRLADLNDGAGLPGDWPVDAGDRARIRTEVAREFFRAEHGRDPEDARELSSTIAKHSRPKTQAVAGFDLTFKPVKSVAVLWALADPGIAARVERAHQAAMKDALDFIEQNALYSREGTGGVRQVDVQGLVATAFTHRDSRAGEPLLHTHVAVANKVQTLDGKWLAIDGRILFKATVAASEVYNSCLERHLATDLGVEFEERPDDDPRKRPVRELVGVDPRLRERWSSRRAAIEVRRDELATDFQRAHGRPPTPIEAVQLAQQATLETRDAKHEPRTLVEQRATWREQAREVLGGDKGIHAMLWETLGSPFPKRLSRYAQVDVDQAARTVITQMENRRSAWQVWHVRAEAERQIRGAGASPGRMPGLVDQVVARGLKLSVSMARPETGIVEPEPQRRRDGSSVYSVAGADLFTSATVMAAEHRLAEAAGRRDGVAVDERAVDMALLESAANGVTLNSGQTCLVRDMATSGARLQLAIAPAGSGKTTAMRALAGAWVEGGGQVLGLAPSAAAAATLRSQIDTNTDTLAKLIHEITSRDPDARPWLDVPISEKDKAKAAGARWDPESRSWYAPGGPRQVAAGAPLQPWRVTVTDIGPKTLVVIDEAGMADTISLDLAVQFVLDRGGSVRLIGDDQQLAAIGAGGVLRDIQATHGACRLTELVRFVDPAEGAASLALREGQPESLGFYLDRGRVHVGDMATMTEDVFGAWQADRGKGLDSIMLAPTRELVSELNQRARAHRLDGNGEPSGDTSGTAGGAFDEGPTVRLADGNPASVGELVITRSNDRRLRTASTDWVKNGDRWTVLEVDDGALRVQHTQSGRLVTLPADYVQTNTELGYATTVHTAQGVSVDTMHGLASGDESRQQLYTMLTRGKQANHVYLEVVGDGDPHSVIRPEMTHPPTPTDLLEQILACDDAPRSATTMLAEQSEPATLLGQAAQRYLDALYTAAEHELGPEKVATLEAQAERVVPDVTEQPAWPALRAHLILTSAHGVDPIAALRSATGSRELDTAGDTAAVLDWRLDDTGLRGGGRGPLPWIPGVPSSLASNDTWGSYLTQRAAKVTDLAATVRAAAIAGTTPSWASTGRPADPVLGDLAVWRAAMLVDDTDRRPTGRSQMQKAAATWQKKLNERLVGDRAPAMDEWGPAIEAATGSHQRATGHDPFAPLLAERLAAMARCGVDAPVMLRRAVSLGTLPDDHAAAALWWRISRHLSPAVAEQVDSDDPARRLATLWTPQLPELLGQNRAAQVQASPWWPTLVTTVDRALARGWSVEALFRGEAAQPLDPGDDPCQALVWRLSVAMDPVPDEHYDPYPEEDEDLWDHVPLPDDTAGMCPPDHPDDQRPPLEEERPLDPVEEVDQDELDRQLLMAELRRGVLGPLEISEEQMNRSDERAMRFASSPVSTDHIAHINALTHAYYRQQLPGSWAAQHLVDRFDTDLAADERLQPGFAPPGWDRLVKHLRGLGVSDEEMIAAGVAKRTESTGRVCDHFVNRLVLPIVHRRDGWENFETVPFAGGDVVLGFVGRRHPDLSDEDKKGPKYLNSPTTSLFAMGAQLYVAGNDLYEHGARPVLVEGPMDALAVTLAGAGQLVGVAPLGTSLTEEQAQQLAAIRAHFGAGSAAELGSLATEFDPWLIVATDNDQNLSGQVATERDYWLLAPHDLDPGHATFPSGLDPADIYTLRGPAGLREAWRVRRVAELAPDRPDDPAALAARCLQAETIARGVAELRQRLESLSDGADLAESSALTLILSVAASELDDFDTCFDALDLQLRRLQHPTSADQLLLRAVLLQQRALRMSDTGDAFLPVSLEVGRLPRDLDPTVCGDFTTGPGGPLRSTVTLQHIRQSMIDSAASLPGASAVEELKAVGLPTWRDRMRGTTPSLIRWKNRQEASTYATFVAQLFKKDFGGGGEGLGADRRPDLFYSVLALEVAGHGAVYSARKELALLRLVQWSGEVYDLADALRLLRQAAAKDELKLTLRRLAASGPLTALSRDARQILRTRITASRLRTVELAVLQSAADMLAPTEARLALDSILESLALGGPPDLPGSWQLPLLRREAAWVTAAAMANVCNAVDEVARVLLTQARQVDSYDQLFDSALRRAARTLDWSAAAPLTREDWGNEMQERLDFLPATSEIVLSALGDTPVQSSSGTAPFDDIIHRLNAVIRGRAEASQIHGSDFGRVKHALERIRRDASQGEYSMGGISESDVAAALVIEVGHQDLLRSLTEFLLDPNVARQHKTPAFDRLARAKLDLPAAVADRFRAEALPLLESTGPNLFESHIVPYPAALRFLGAHHLRDAGEILGLISTLAASGDRHARREAAVTISLLSSASPSSSLMALCMSLTRDDDVEVRAYAGRGLAVLREYDESLESVATGRLIDLLDEDGFHPPLVMLGALEDLADLPPTVTNKIRQLAAAHPSRSVRKKAADVLDAAGGD